MLPFILLVAVYLSAAQIRTQENSQQKLLPTVGKMVKAMDKAAFTEDKRTGKYILWQDTWASLKRLVIGVVLSSLLGFVVGLNMGLLPGIRHLGVAFITFAANIPPLAVLPILFIALGVEEVSKVALIFIGTFPLITRDIYLSARQIPQEMVVKALTLGANQFRVIYRVVWPQIIPRLLNTVRLAMGAAWLFLIAAEAIAAKSGLGYRVFLVRRYLAMDTIIPYVLWITLLAYLIDSGLKYWISWRYPWYQPESQQLNREDVMELEKFLRVDNVSKIYGQNVVLEEVNLHLAEGEFCTVVGPSGCGKSTLLRLILGQERPTSGRVMVAGAEISEPSPDRGIVYQRYSLFPHLTVAENIMAGDQLSQPVFKAWSQRKTIRREAMQYLEYVQLAAHADQISSRTIRRHAATGGHCSSPDQKTQNTDDG